MEGGRALLPESASRFAHLAYPVRRLGSQVPRATGYAGPEVTLADLPSYTIGLPCCTFQLPGQKLHPLHFAQPAYPGTNGIAHPSVYTSSLPRYTMQPKGLARAKERREGGKSRLSGNSLNPPPPAHLGYPVAILDAPRL
jgi:hypothetical protein